jgi:pimeloyl-ACP methyl ester carboxylesterase
MRQLASLLGLSALALSQHVDIKTKDSFDWTTIAPSKTLEYHPCHDGFQCARLTVPLDWQNTSDPRIAVIAVIKLPAIVPDSDPSFAGPVLTNPGGPGGSGVHQALVDARRVQGIIDKPGKRHYEIIGFDPRGIANSWPRANCLPHNDLARDAFAYEVRGVGALDGNSSLAAVPRMLALYGGLASKCDVLNEEREPGAEILGFMSTPSVCRDMVQIIDKIDQLRRNEADRGQVDEDERLELKKREMDNEDVPRLQYLGYSYGTILGNYFASLFPERVGRLVLDGVVDAIDYSSGPVGLSPALHFTYS